MVSRSTACSISLIEIVQVLVAAKKDASEDECLYSSGMLHSVSQCQCAAPAAPKYMHLAADVQLLSKRNNVFYQILGFIIAERCLGVGRNVWFAFSATTLVIQDDPVALGIKETSHLRIVGASSTWPS